LLWPHLRPGKITATLNGRMANVVGYFVPLHSLTTLVTHMYSFECYLSHVWERCFIMQRYEKYLRITNYLILFIYSTSSFFLQGKPFLSHHFCSDLSETPYFLPTDVNDPNFLKELMKSLTSSSVSFPPFDSV